MKKSVASNSTDYVSVPATICYSSSLNSMEIKVILFLIYRKDERFSCAQIQRELKISGYHVRLALQGLHFAKWIQKTRTYNEIGRPSIIVYQYSSKK